MKRKKEVALPKNVDSSIENEKNDFLMSQTNENFQLLIKMSAKQQSNKTKRKKSISDS